MNLPARSLALFIFLPLAAAPQKTWQGSWSATAGNGATLFGGTWDAMVSDDPDTLTGNWALMDQAGATLADGTWAARKDQNVWHGIWKARTRADRIYSGTWRAQSKLPASMHFSALFESALSQMAGGTWRMGAYSGAWSIRAYPRR